MTKVIRRVRGHIGPLRRDSWENLKLDSSSASAFSGLKRLSVLQEHLSSPPG